MKRPAFQFYPADWRKDSALQSCGMAARGLWHEMMCIMHECVPYGHLAVNDQPMSTAQLGRLVGESERSVRNWLVELKASGVYSETQEGVIFSRRMVSDERIRNVRAECGRLGGNPNLVEGKVNQIDNHIVNLRPTPSSSSSSSEKQKLLPGGDFLRFWGAWPNHHRKAARGKCFDLWTRKKLEPLADQIVAHVEALKQTDQWRTGYVPAPMVYLNKESWDGAEIHPKSNGLSL